MAVMPAKAGYRPSLFPARIVWNPPSWAPVSVSQACASKPGA